MSPPNLETGHTEVDAKTDLVQLSTKLVLIVPPSIKKCREEGVAITSKARIDMVKNSLIILQGQIGRNKPTNAEFEICAQKIVHIVPELKDATPPIRKDAFKQWVRFNLLTLHFYPIFLSLNYIHVVSHGCSLE